MTLLTDEKYYPESFISDVKDDKKPLSEKIKLEFSLLHADPGSYSIEVKLYGQQAFDFYSEVKRCISGNKITFDKFFVCDFYFERQQNIHIILHKDNSAIKFKTTLGYILGCLNCELSINLGGNKMLVIKGEKLINDEDLLNVRISLNDSNDPYYFVKNKIYYLITCGSNDIYKSAEIMDNGVFIPIQIPICLLKPSYTISFYNYNKVQIFTYNRITDEIKTNNIKEYKINFSNGHYFILKDNSKITRKYTFFNYLKSGIKIAVSFGIDFSGENVNNYLKNHYIQENTWNEYEKAIYLCGNILGYYDYDQKYPTFGIGAINKFISSQNTPSFFNLNLTNNPEIEKIDNVINTYRKCIKQNQLIFLATTNFAPLIRKVMSNINKNNPFEYHILLILTTGLIDDMQETIDTLVDASMLPLSVIIVGIGNGNFANMERLDGDKYPLTSSKGKKRIRDIVQFVPFSKYQNDKEKLTMEVLAEIPRQIVEFYTIKNLKPEDIANLTRNTKMIRRTKTNPFQDNKNNNPNKEYFLGFGDNFGQTFIYAIQNNNQIKSQDVYNNQNIVPGCHFSLSDGNIIHYPKTMNINKDNSEKKSYSIYNNIYGASNNNI